MINQPRPRIKVGSPKTIVTVVLAVAPAVVEDEGNGIGVYGLREGTRIADENLVSIAEKDPIAVSPPQIPELLSGWGFSAPRGRGLAKLVVDNGGVALAELPRRIGGTVIEDNDLPEASAAVEHFGQVAPRFVAGEHRADQWLNGAPPCCRTPQDMRQSASVKRQLGIDAAVAPRHFHQHLVRSHLHKVVEPMEGRRWGDK